MTTTLPVAAAVAAGEELFVFAVGADQGVYYNHKTPDRSWAAAWTRIPSGQTKVAVCPVVNSVGVLSVIITGLDSRLYVSTYYADGAKWSAWQSLDGGTGSTAFTAAAVENNRQYAYFVTGNDKHVYVNANVSGTTF
ncbi:hypothetical protein AB0I39_06650 [Kitasatospora purpeofusca]|uniref:hypothetical protein n=1 Tax=Kitasatospora purpeofusca TaxID=67352 RepID=UPI0033EA2CFF